MNRITLDEPGATDASITDEVAIAAALAHDDGVITELVMREGVVALIVPAGAGRQP